MIVTQVLTILDKIHNLNRGIDESMQDSFSDKLQGYIVGNLNMDTLVLGKGTSEYKVFISDLSSAIEIYGDSSPDTPINQNILFSSISQQLDETLTQKDDLESLGYLIVS